MDRALSLNYMVAQFLVKTEPEVKKYLIISLNCLFIKSPKDIERIYITAENGCNVKLSSSGLADRGATQMNVIMVNGKFIYPDQRYGVPYGISIATLSLSTNSCIAVRIF